MTHVDTGIYGACPLVEIGEVWRKLAMLTRRSFFGLALVPLAPALAVPQCGPSYLRADWYRWLPQRMRDQCARGYGRLLAEETDRRLAKQLSALLNTEDPSAA